MGTMQEVMMRMNIETIKKATGFDFTGCEHVLEYRLKDKSLNTLIAEMVQINREELEAANE